MSSDPNVPSSRLGGSRHAPNVIVADDDAMFRELLCTYVSAAGCVGVPAADAMQATMFAVRHMPAAILLDLNMPGGTGYTALERLRGNARLAHIPVIVVSGALEAGVQERARALGARAFLTKPVDPTTLQAALATVLTPPEATH